MKLLFLSILFVIAGSVQGQELFTYTEPASNMAAKSIGVRVSNYFMDKKNADIYNYQVVPEVMWGISRKLMLHVAGYLSNKENDFQANAASLYLKYRFYSADDVHSHFRMAAFAKGAINNMTIHHPAVNLAGDNSGYEAGLIATKLINKLALSATASWVHAADNGSGNKFPYTAANRNAFSWSLSSGKLMLPKEYKDYEQVNLNMMLEMLGQTSIGNGKSYVDLAPSIQFIFLSKMRLDIGYRFAVVNDLVRDSENGFLLRFEYNFFSVYK